MVEIKPEIDPDTHMTHDESWEWAHKQYEAQREQILNARAKRGGAPIRQQKKK